MDQPIIAGLSGTQLIAVLFLLQSIGGAVLLYLHTRQMAGVVAALAAIDHNRNLKDVLEPLATSVPGHIVSEMLAQLIQGGRFLAPGPEVAKALDLLDKVRRDVSDGLPNTDGSVDAPPKSLPAPPVFEDNSVDAPFKLPGVPLS